MIKKISIVLVAIMALAFGISVYASDYITGYDVNNNYAPIQVKAGVYMPGISLYPTPKACDSCNIGGTTQGNIRTKGTLTVDGASTLTGNVTMSGNLSVTGTMIGDYKVTAKAATSVYSTTTLTAADSGTVYAVKASGTTITLPAVSATGTHFMFLVNGNITTASTSITSAEGDNIEGSLIVAGAVVDCDQADIVYLSQNLENIGDFVELVSTGTYWILLRSGFLTANSSLCSG